MSSPKCQTCNSSGWVTRSVGVHGEGFGQAIPCRDCTDQNLAEEERRREFVGLPNDLDPKTFDNWEPKPDMDESFLAAQAFAAGTLGHPVLVLQGPNGTGKGHLLEAAGREMMEQGLRVKYVFVPDWLAGLKSTFDNRGEERFEQLFEACASIPDVLLMDDLGAEQITQWTIPQVTRLFDLRYRNDQLTIVTTNDDENKTDRLQGSRIADRLFDMGSGKVRVVSNRAESYRTGNRR